MKRLIATGAVLLLILCGCAAQTEPAATNPDPVPTPTALPTGIYDANSRIEKETDGAIKAYPLAFSDTVGFLPIGSDILLFSGETETTLTRLSGDTLHTTASATLRGWIRPEDPALHVHENGITYYDALENDLVYLDAQLLETRRIPLPETMYGSPALSADLKTVYYCTASGLYSRNLETNLDRLLKEMYFRNQTPVALHCDDAVIACRIEDEDNTPKQLYISTGTGILLHEVPDNFVLKTYGDFYFARHMDGIYPELLIGDSEQGPTLLTPATYNCSAFPLLEIDGTVLAAAGTGATHLDYYDLHSGKRTSSITLDGLTDIRSISSSGPFDIWFLGYDPQTHRDVLYRWDLQKSKVCDNRNYFSARYSYDHPDLQGLVDCREIADTMSRQYGVQILLWTDATAFEPWDYTLVPEYQVSVIRENLKELDQFLSLYPEGFLQKAAERTGSGRIQICLVRSILGKEDVAGTLDEAVGLQYWDHNANSYLCLSVQPEGLFRNACHEMSHIIDSRVLTVCKAYDDWSTLNPSGFQYGYSHISNLSLDDRGWTVGTNRAFIDLYSMTYPKEDRARIMEFAVMDGYEHCFESETMQNKLRKICLGIRQAFDLEKASESLLWEQYLKHPLYPK